MKYAALVKAIHSASVHSQGRAALAVNQALVLRNWLVGAWIFEFEQSGKDRAKYGERLLETLAADLQEKGVTGLNVRVLDRSRLLYRTYPILASAIPATLSPEFLGLAHAGDTVPRIAATLSPESAAITSPSANQSSPQIRQKVSAESPAPLAPETLLRLSWSHLQELIAIDDPWKRAFFENECLLANWSVRQLRRQIGSLLYERTGLSTNKKAVIEKARKQERQQDFTDLIRDPYVLEFTGLAERAEYLESDLESALLTHLQGFLLELGAGFCFEARQKRITVGKSHEYIDLVFYHRILRCHVLIDLKIRPFKHGDAGQIHPVRYSYADHLLLRLRSSKPQRRKLLHRFHERFATANRGTSGRAGDIHERSIASRTRILRSMPVPSRRHQARKVFEERMGKTLHQGAPRGLSHGVNFYLNWWKANAVEDGDNPPVGIILCSDRDEAAVEFATAGMDQKLFVSRYLVALPSVEKLRRFLEADRERIESQMPPPSARKRAPRKPKS